MITLIGVIIYSLAFIAILYGVLVFGSSLKDEHAYSEAAKRFAIVAFGLGVGWCYFPRLLSTEDRHFLNEQIRAPQISLDNQLVAVNNYATAVMMAIMIVAMLFMMWWGHAQLAAKKEAEKKTKDATDTSDAQAMALTNMLAPALLKSMAAASGTPQFPSLPSYPHPALPLNNPPSRPQLPSPRFLGRPPV